MLWLLLIIINNCLLFIFNLFLIIFVKSNVWLFMVNINIILAALFCAVAPVNSVVQIPSELEETAEPRLQLGKEVVSSIRSTYEKGGYRVFLEEIDASYKAADLSGLVQMREKQSPLEFQEEWELRFLEFQKQKNKDLLASISDSDDSVFAQKVRSYASLLTPEQEKALKKINRYIAMAPSTGANADENRLIEIDLEYEYKLLYATLPNQDLSSREIKAHQIALRMEKMDKMVEAAKQFQDHELKKNVGTAADVLDTMLARSFDGADFNVLLKSNAKPTNSIEKNVYAVLSLHQEKLSELMKELK